MQALLMRSSRGRLCTRLRKYRLTKMEGPADVARSVDTTYRHGEMEGSKAIAMGALRRTRRLRVFSLALPCLCRRVSAAVTSVCQGAMSVRKWRCIYSRHDISSLPRVSKSMDGRDKGNRVDRYRNWDKGEIRLTHLHKALASQLLLATKCPRRNNQEPSPSSTVLQMLSSSEVLLRLS